MSDKTVAQESQDMRQSTMAELLREKPKRGRPKHAVSRQNVYVALNPSEKAEMKRLVALLPRSLKRADLADLVISVLTARLEALRRALVGRNREIPEGVTDLDSLYLLWDLPLPDPTQPEKWTSIRVSPQQVIELGREHGTLNAAFGVTRSQTFVLGLAALAQFLEKHPLQESELTVNQIRALILQAY
ncbi:MAG: hypothetical protein KDE48_16675 [Anaerolineales bacterium]|nr:hypothetical protein [Anaerolineales bacterium]